MAKRLTKHERTMHAARVKAHNSATYARECATNGASPERLTRAQAAAERDAAAFAALEHHGHKPGECSRCDLADAVIEQLAVDAAPRVLKCDMLVACKAPVTHVDNKGYVYCASHGEHRKLSVPCRALRPNEITKLTNGQTIKY